MSKPKAEKTSSRRAYMAEAYMHAIARAGFALWQYEAKGTKVSKRTEDQWAEETEATRERYVAKAKVCITQFLWNL